MNKTAKPVTALDEKENKKKATPKAAPKKELENIEVPKTPVQSVKKESNLIGKQILTHLMAARFKEETKTNATLKEAELWYSCFVDSVKDLLRQEKEVRLTSFATFSIRKRAARIGFNPKSKEKVALPESKRACCRMSKQVLVAETA
jgi:DNA-binding protein HU-beta